MGCAASKEEKRQDNRRSSDGPRDEANNTHREDKDATEFASGVAPSHDDAASAPFDSPSSASPAHSPRAGATNPLSADCAALNTFSFARDHDDEDEDHRGDDEMQGQHGGDTNGGAFVAFGGAAFAATEDGDDSTAAAPSAPRKPRRVAVSDECADEDDAWMPPVVPKSAEEMELIKGVLEHNPLLKSLEGGDLETVVAAMSLMTFEAGTRVLEQGGEGGRHYYVIASGTVEIIKNNQLICTFSEGQGFGEMELLYVQPCAATVRTRVRTTTWALDRRTYKKCVMRLAVERRKLYGDLLTNVDFLANMTEYEKQTLADALSPVTLQPGQYLLNRGERNEWMYILIEGVVQVWGTVRNEAGEEQQNLICELSKGNCVGELEFLNQHPTLADCVAKTTVRACILHRDHFELCLGPVVDVLRRTVRDDKYAFYASHVEDAFADSPSSSAAAAPTRSNRRHRHAVSAEVDADPDSDNHWVPPVIAKSPESEIQADVAIRRCPLFSALSDDDAMVVVKALQPVHLANGTRIIEEGKVPEEAFWYIIANGAVSITQQATGDDGTVIDRELALLTEGQSFGELDLMYSTASTVSAVALCTDGVDVFRLDRRTYRKLIMKVTVERRALYRELLTGIPFLAALTEPQQQLLADALSPVNFRPGDMLCRIDNVNEWMYIIVDGVVEVYGAAGLKVCDLRRGEMVGELEFFNKHSCVANCSAKTHVKACRLHRQHFEACMGPVSPLHRVVGPQAPFSIAFYGELNNFLKASRADMARFRALASAQPMHISKAMASIKSAVLGASDGGVAVATLAHRHLNSTLCLDGNTQALLTCEDTLRDMVAAKELSRAQLKVRTSPHTYFAPPAQKKNATVGGEADDVIDDQFDFLLWAPTVHPVIPPAAVASEALLAHRFSSSSLQAAMRFDLEAAPRLRSTGGYVAAFLTNTAGICMEGVDVFGQSSAEDICRSWLPKISTKAVETAYISMHRCPNAFEAELRRSQHVSSRRGIMLGADQGTNDPFSAAACLPPRVAEHLESLVTRTARCLFVAFRCEPTTAAVGIVATRQQASTAPPPSGEALAIVGAGPDAMQGPVEFRETFEYERYLPKSGPANPRHWSSLPAFDYLDDETVNERRNAAARAAARRTSGLPSEWPRSAEGTPLSLHVNRAHVAFRPEAVQPMLDAERLQELASKAKRTAEANDAASKLRELQHARASPAGGSAANAYAEPKPLLHHLFSRQSRQSRAGKLRKKVLSSTAAAEQYLDNKVRNSPSAELAVLADLDRLLYQNKSQLGLRKR